MISILMRQLCNKSIYKSGNKLQAASRSGHFDILLEEEKTSYIFTKRMLNYM